MAMSSFPQARSAVTTGPPSLRRDAALARRAAFPREPGRGIRGDDVGRPGHCDEPRRPGCLRIAANASLHVVQIFPNELPSAETSRLFIVDAKSPPQKSPSSIIDSNGPLSDPTPAVRPWRRQPLFMPQSGRSSGLRRSRKVAVRHCAGTLFLDRSLRSRPDPHRLVAAAQGLLAAVFEPSDNLGDLSGR